MGGGIVGGGEFIGEMGGGLFVWREMLGRGILVIVRGVLKKGVMWEYMSMKFVEGILDNGRLYWGVEKVMGV